MPKRKQIGEPIYRKHNDTDFLWMEKKYPEMPIWRDYAKRWIKHDGRNLRQKVIALDRFFGDYIKSNNMENTPALFLRMSGKSYPNYWEILSRLSDNERQKKYDHDYTADFLSWILENDFSQSGPSGQRYPIEGYGLPFRRIQKIADRNLDDETLRPHMDREMRWLPKHYPELREWHALAVEWVAGQTGRVTPRLKALQSFFREFIIAKALPVEPAALLDGSVEVPDFYEVNLAIRAHHDASKYTTHVHKFLKWVLKSKFERIGGDGLPHLPSGFRNPVAIKWNGENVFGRTSDLELNWVIKKYPQLGKWREYAAAWIKSETKGLDQRLKAITLWLERYIIGQGLPTEPETILRRNAVLPDYYKSCVSVTKSGEKKENGDHVSNLNNRTHDFIEWVLKTYYSDEDDDGHIVVSPAYRNPVPYRSHSGGWVNRESVHSPLPFAFVDELRSMLAEGPNFGDWKWAQNALGRSEGETGPLGTDWFSVAEKDLDKDDPDCVWRVQHYENGHHELQMWSPVRWVALLLKLQLPLRTMQVRLLDSGEADYWRYQDGGWIENPNLLAEGTKRKPVHQGVFRRVDHIAGIKVPLILYINTNKTADQKYSGPARGYEVPWPLGGSLHQNPFYWLEKLRNWQEKYNPLQRRTKWTELGTQHIPLKSSEQLAEYPDACFLFRMREHNLGDRHLPVGNSLLLRPWYDLLFALQERLKERKQFDEDGEPFALVPPWEESNRGVTTNFPLHSLRVSLITALALEGQVPFPILQKLAGHSRLLMTIYYTKISAKRMNDALNEALAHLENKKSESVKQFAANAKYEKLFQIAVCNSESSIKAAIPEDAGARNPAGWMIMHHGMCVVGGNTSEVEDNKRIGGCYNGGPNIGTDLQPKWAPVPGGSRNCVRCRWFVTQAKQLDNLVVTFNNYAYHFDEARNRCLAEEDRFQNIKRRKFDAELAGAPFTEMNVYLQIERVYEGAMKQFSDLAENLVATYRLIDRCIKSISEDSEKSSGNKLIAVGRESDIRVAFEETESELLQLSGVCEGVEIYPDLNPGKAVIRRSQLLDGALYEQGYQPVFLALSEEEQLKVGNAFMRNIANQLAPEDAASGLRKAVALIDSGTRLSELFGMELEKVLPNSKSVQRIIYNGSLEAAV